MLLKLMMLLTMLLLLSMCVDSVADISLYVAVYDVHFDNTVVQFVGVAVDVYCCYPWFFRFIKDTNIKMKHSVIHLNESRTDNR